MKTRLLIIVAACMFFLIPRVSFSQETVDYGIWGNAGFGAIFMSDISDEVGISLDYGLSARYCNWTVSYQRTNYLSPLLFLLESAESNSYLIGYTKEITASERGVTKLAYLVQLGISSIKYEETIDLFAEENSTIVETVTGFPVEAGLKFNITEAFGLTLIAFSDFNKKENIYGIKLNLILGKL